LRWNFVTFPKIAWWAKQLQIAAVVTPSLAYRNYMVDVVFIQQHFAIIAFVVLNLDHFIYIFS